MEIRYNSDGNSKAAGGTGFLSMLQILFIALKLCKVIHWSWLWVLAPLWITGSLMILIIVIFIIVCKTEARRKHW